MSDKHPEGYVDCQSDQGNLPSISPTGDRSECRIPVHSHVGEDSVRTISSIGEKTTLRQPVISSLGDEPCEIACWSSLGDGPQLAFPVQSTVGRGPRGFPGPPVPIETVRHEIDTELDRRIVLVPRAEWPPADPEDNVLYLRAVD